MPPIERLARAMYLRQWGSSPPADAWESEPPSSRKPWLDDATAFLEELREPDYGMLKAAAAVLEPGAASLVWVSMVDAMLAEAQGNTNGSTARARS